MISKINMFLARLTKEKKRGERWGEDDTSCYQKGKRGHHYR